MSTGEKTEKWFRTEITLGQLVAITVTISSLLIGSWINVNGRITAIEIQMELQRQERLENKAFQKEILQQIYELRIITENKQNRQ